MTSKMREMADAILAQLEVIEKEQKALDLVRHKNPEDYEYVDAANWALAHLCLDMYRKEFFELLNSVPKDGEND
jgi:hypothetical protein